MKTAERKEAMTHVRIDSVALAVMLDMLDRIASKLENGDDPLEVARHIRIFITTAESTS